jgi:ferredoxin
MTKNCDVCGSEFDGHHNAKRCSDACSREAIRIRMAKYFQSEKGKAALANWRQSEKGKAAIAEYQQSEKGKASHAKYRKSEKGKKATRASSHKRRAHLAEVESDGIHYELEDKCVVCYSTENLTMDHMIALANGGTDTIDNKTTLCKSCNSSKGNHIDYRDPGFTAWIVRRRLGI